MITSKPKSSRTRASATVPPEGGREVVLLAVTGMSPAILTETVWALANPRKAGETPVIPHRVVIVTTLTGKGQIERDLLPDPSRPGSPSVWGTLRATVIKDRADLAGHLMLADLRVITAPNPRTGVAEPLPDIRSPVDNEAAADFIMDEMRKIVANPDTQLIASLAGGRKTMGALLYAAMSLLGREKDRLTHVLVSEPFETCRGFFFPSQPVQELSAGFGNQARPVRASDAVIELADVPFVPLRNLFERDLVKPPGSFASLVARCSSRVAELARREIKLQVCADRPEIRVNEIPVKLSVAEYVLLRHLAEAARERRPAIDGYEAAAEAVVKTAKLIYNQHDKNDFSDWRYKALPDGKGFEEINERWITKRLDSMRKKLELAGPEVASLDLLLPVRGRFSLDLPPSSITLPD